MTIKNLNELEITKDKNISSNFISVGLENLALKSRVYKGDFYLDSFNYFPVTSNYLSFLDIFCWKNKSKYEHFFTKDFYYTFEKNKDSFKEFNDAVVIGSSPGDNYFRNLITFVPRVLFIPDKQVNLVVHRNSSNKLRKFIKEILKQRQIEIKKFIYLDDDFYSFKNSLIPQFFSEEASIKILNQVFKKKYTKKNRIYLTRKNDFYRKIINEGDLISELKSKNFTIIDYETLNINEQIDLFNSAEIIISPTSSALANIVFCNEGTKILEITPKYKHKYENQFKFRYSSICKVLNLKYYSMEADPIFIDELDKNTNKFIDSNIIKESNYYKNLLIKKNEFIQFINQI